MDVNPVTMDTNPTQNSLEILESTPHSSLESHPLSLLEGSTPVIGSQDSTWSSKGKVPRIHNLIEKTFKVKLQVSHSACDLQCCYCI